MVAHLENLYATIKTLQPARLARMRWNFTLAWMAAAAAVLPQVSAAASIVHTDSRGHRVVIQTPVRRAVIFEFYEVVPALNCWDGVAAIGSSAYQNDLMLAARPGIKAEIPAAGTAESVEIEGLLRLKPEVVVAWPYKPENIRFMEDKGLKVITIFPNTISDLYGLIRLYGRMFEREQRAENAILRMEEIFRVVRTRSAGIPASARKKVLWLTQANRTYGGVAMPNEIIELTGARNAAREVSERYADVSMEAIVKWNPDVIFLWNGAHIGVKDILGSSQWRSVKAVREGKVYRQPDISTWSPRLAPLVLWMAKRIYPDLYRDTSVVSVTDQFYRSVFGISYAKAALDDL